MASKKKKNKDKKELDINQTVLSDNTEVVLKDVANSSSVEDNEDDEFEKLLQSFINTDTPPEEPKEKHKDLESLHILPEKQDDLKIEKSDYTSPEGSIELGADESELAQAYENFLNAVSAIANLREIILPDFSFQKKMLYPNYKPSIGRKIVADASVCWDIMLQAFPDKLSSIKPNASDEEFLNFAEGLSDQNLQLAIISYVEILIDIENCEISYEEKRLKAQRKRIERELYEEYQRRQERKRKFIEAVQKKQFPVDAERLINNYFKTALKDADGAYEVLTKNPAVYAPIENDKIKPRFFGLIKPSPKDGIRENYRLGIFLKYLKA